MHSTLLHKILNWERKKEKEGATNTYRLVLARLPYTFGTRRAKLPAVKNKHVSRWFSTNITIKYNYQNEEIFWADARLLENPSLVSNWDVCWSEQLQSVRKTCTSRQEWKTVQNHLCLYSRKVRANLTSLIPRPLPPEERPGTHCLRMRVNIPFLGDS